GGGIIGCCTAYFLTRHPAYSPAIHRITLLEASSTSSGGRTADSLGKAGGLLALWAFPRNIVPLSFGLHEELAREHGGERRWGYRRCHASQVDCRARLPASCSSSPSAGAAAVAVDDDKAAAAEQALQRIGAPADLDWVDAEHSLRAYEGMGTPRDTAQVHPELFTRSMAQLAEEKGVRIVTGARVTAIHKEEQGRESGGGAAAVKSVTYQKDGQEHTLPTTDCVVAAGPWTRLLLPDAPVTASRAHSVVIRTPRPVSAYALFTSITLPAGFPAPTTSPGEPSSPAVTPLKRSREVEPEIYARPDGTAYACGPVDEAVELPPLGNAGVVVDEGRCEDILRQVAGISDALGSDGTVLARQACYLPQGGPWIGPVDQRNTKGLIVAAGHTCWGIQNAPGTGKLVSEIIFDGRAKSASLGGCDP
ncbi:FAD dependent oxidoreductase, partial [Xylariales sp. PMI_506]